MTTARPTEPVEHEVVVPVEPGRAFELYVNRPGRTHPPKGQSGRPHRIVYEPFAGGRWYEVGADGTEYEWGRVLTWDPPRVLTLAWMVNATTGVWAFDPDPTHASLAEITFTSVPEGTRVCVRHHGFERHGPAGGHIRAGVNNGWVEDLDDLHRASSEDQHPHLQSQAHRERNGPMYSSPHVILLTSDIQPAITFYEGLGFEEVFRVPGPGGPIHVDLQLDGYRIGLATDATARDEHGLDPITSGHRAVIVLWTENIHTALEHAATLGATALSQPRPLNDRLTVAFIEDPAGHAVQLVQETGAGQPD